MMPTVHTPGTPLFSPLYTTLGMYYTLPPWVYHHSCRTHGAGRYVYTGSTVRDDEALGSVLGIIRRKETSVRL